MKQEDKDLLLKDLCGRLPYGVKMNHIADDEHSPSTLIGIAKDMITLEGLGGYECVDVEHYKPYLYPLSSMTEEQKEELYIVTNGKFNACYKYIDNCKSRNWSEWGTTEYNWIRHCDIDLLYTWLNKNNFDYRGLIPMGLALNATGKSIY